jgi:hypothetical protein
VKNFCVLVSLLFSINAIAETNLRCKFAQYYESHEWASEVPDDFKPYCRLLTDSLILKMERNFTMPRISAISPNYLGGENKFRYLNNEWLCNRIKARPDSK